MSTEIPQKLTLHGLGFIILQLGGMQRLHVWHPDIPKRTCFEDSQIHDHRFGFNSKILVGSQMNIRYLSNIPNAQTIGVEPTHQGYLHEGERTDKGNRPWIPNDQFFIEEFGRMTWQAGNSYSMQPYTFHATEPGGDGRVATLMQKTTVVQPNAPGATSLCKLGTTPDVDFDRYQMSQDDMWSIIREVMSLA